MKTNVRIKRVSTRKRTHGGAVAANHSAEQDLRRTVMACMLWENNFYEGGDAIAARIGELVPKVKADTVSRIAIEAREKGNLRHAPLLVVREMCHHPDHCKLVGRTLERVIKRADEITEFLSIYWKEGRAPLANQVKKGLAAAFRKFDAYQLAKYDRPGAVALRDAMFLVRPTPVDEQQAETWRKLANKSLESPDTWEVALSQGKGEAKKETWTRLLEENKLGGLALVRNLRNMEQASVEPDLIKKALTEARANGILPFQFITAAKAAPRYEAEIEDLMLRNMRAMPKLPGKSIIVVDVSGSMYHTPVSQKSEMTRAHAACALAMMAREVCESAVVYATAGNDRTRTHKTQLVPSRHGFALSEGIYKLCEPLGGGGIFLQQVMEYVKKAEKQADRVIVITDEQDCDTNGSPSKADAFGTSNYIFNVGTYDRGIGFNKWVTVSGFSENSLSFIKALEDSNADSQSQQ